MAKDADAGMAAAHEAPVFWLGVDPHGVDSSYLDCIDDNLAALLRFHGARDARTPFACQWFFDFALDSLPTLRRFPVVEAIRLYAGLRVLSSPHAPNEWLAAVEASLLVGCPPLLLGDAYFMPWLPYFGRVHQEHSFVVDGVSPDARQVHVVDAYQNQTEWGEAVPTTVVLDARTLEKAVESLAGDGPAVYMRLVGDQRPATPPDLRQMLWDNAASVFNKVSMEGALGRFATHYSKRADDSEAVARFTLACWLVARSRALHAIWLHDCADAIPALSRFAEDFEERIVQPWRRAQEFAYVALRRVARGRPAPLTSFELVGEGLQATEADMAGRLLTLLN
jgi:hypothetical protein